MFDKFEDLFSAERRKLNKIKNGFERTYREIDSTLATLAQMERANNARANTMSDPAYTKEELRVVGEQLDELWGFIDTGLSQLREHFKDEDKVRAYMKEHFPGKRFEVFNED